MATMSPALTRAVSEASRGSSRYCAPRFDLVFPGAHAGRDRAASQGGRGTAARLPGLAARHRGRLAVGQGGESDCTDQAANVMRYLAVGGGDLHVAGQLKKFSTGWPHARRQILARSSRRKGCAAGRRCQSRLRPWPRGCVAEAMSSPPAGTAWTCQKTCSTHALKRRASYGPFATPGRKVSIASSLPRRSSNPTSLQRY